MPSRSQVVGVYSCVLSLFPLKIHPPSVSRVFLIGHMLCSGAHMASRISAGCHQGRAVQGCAGQPDALAQLGNKDLHLLQWQPRGTEEPLWPHHSWRPAALPVRLLRHTRWCQGDLLLLRNHLINKQPAHVVLSSASSSFRFECQAFDSRMPSTLVT